MKKILTLILLVSLVINTKAQDTLLNHINYSSLYSKKLNYPIKVEWWETRGKDKCTTPLPRKDQFAPDPLLKNETNLQKDYDAANHSHKINGLKGFDRGHMCPAASNECSGAEVLTECFYFSNMVPQYHSLNAGDWKTLETLTREIADKYDSVHVWSGGIGESEIFGNLSIPTQCWKVIYIIKTKEYQCYIFNNTPDKPVGLAYHKVEIIDIEKLTGFKF